MMNFHYIDENKIIYIVLIRWWESERTTWPLFFPHRLDEGAQPTGDKDRSNKPSLVRWKALSGMLQRHILCIMLHFYRNTIFLQRRPLAVFRFDSAKFKASIYSGSWRISDESVSEGFAYY